MKKIILFFIFMLVATTGLADRIVLDNQASAETKNRQSKIAIQWANSAREAEESNNRIMQGLKLNANSLQVLTQSGKLNVSVPKKAAYFRVLVWSKGGEEPDLLTNWVNIIPNKTYTLNADHLVPVTLMSGTGC